MVDVLIIGAGPSGSMSAALLAKKGYDVLVLERQKFPRFSIGESLLASSAGMLQDAGMLDTVLAMQALGYACPDNGLVFSLNAQMWSCMVPLAHYGTEEQKRRWLPGLCAGDLIGVHAITEPEC